MKKNFSQQEIDEMAKQYKTGSTLGTVAKKFDTNINIVKALIDPYIRHSHKPEEKNGAQPVRKESEFTETDIRQMLRHKNNGYTYDKIAELCGSTPEIVEKVIKDNINKFDGLFAPKTEKASVNTPNKFSKIKKGKRNRLTQEEIDKILDYDKIGFKITDIAQDLNRDEKTVRNVIRRHEEEKKLMTALPTKESPLLTPTIQSPKQQPTSAPDDEPRFTEQQIKTMLELYKQNKSLSDISETTGIPLQSVSKIAVHIPTQKETRIERAPAPKEKTLDDFEPNEMFIHLFGKVGYYIKDNQICIMQEHVVKLKEIIEESKKQN